MTRGEPIVVTGIGAVCALGPDPEALWQRALRGERGIRELSLFDTAGHRTNLAAPVDDAGFTARALPPTTPRGGGRADRFALAAAAQATRALPADGLRTARAGVFFGSSTGALFEGERFLQALLGGREGALRTIATLQNDGPGTAVARQLGVRGPVVCYSTACTSANVALAAALDALRSGELDVAVAGGADELCEITYAGFNSLRAVDPSPTRPFRADRAGLSMGEGAGVLLLERRAHAVARGAAIRCELAGAGRSCDAHHVSAPDPEGRGAAAAMLAALADAGLDVAAVTFVNAHGTGTPHNDVAEASALRFVFGERVRSLPVTSTKSMVGHLLGAAGGIEAVLTVLAIEHRLLPPTAGDGPTDPALGLDVAWRTPRPLPGSNVGISTNLAFGGNNAVVVLRSA